MGCRLLQLLAGAALAATSGAAYSGGQEAAAQPVLSGSATVDNSGGGAPGGKLRGGLRLDYRIPVSVLGDTLDLYGGYNEAGAAWVRSAGNDGNSWQDGARGAMLGARYSQLLTKGEGHESRLNVGAGVKSFRAGSMFDAESGNDVTVYPLSLNYSGNWLFDKGELSGSVTVLHNLGGARGGQDEFNRVRPGADANYSVLRLAASMTKLLPRDFQVRAAVNGQYTRDKLVPGEQIGIAGGALVRGFSARDLSNDSGLTANVELYSPELCGIGARWRCRALVFYDKGLIKRNRELGGELRTKSIGSVGVGLRVNISRDVNLQVDYGHVVRSSLVPQQDKNRLHLRVDLSW